MTRIYAGILGSLAFATTVARGLVHGMAVEPTLAQALGNLALFAAVGLALGWIAERTIVESVSRQFEKDASPSGGGQTPSAG